MRWLGFDTFGRPRLTNGSADGLTRQGSYSALSGLNPPVRSSTNVSLPPYSSPRANWTRTENSQYAKTPSELLGLGTFQSKPEGSDGKEMVASPQNSPNTLRPLTELDEQSELDSKEALESLEQRRNTTNESPTGFGIPRPLSEGSSTASRISTSPTTSSRRTSMTGNTSTSRRDSIFALESAVVEAAIENLSGVQASYYKAKSKITYHVSTIESFRNKQTGQRYIVISPPISSNIKLYLGTSNLCPKAQSIKRSPRKSQLLQYESSDPWRLTIVRSWFPLIQSSV